MRPLHIEISNFRGWKSKVALSLDSPITVIVGENGRGKSSTTNAIEWCLFGGEITRKGSGIEERQDWEIHPRDAEGVTTEVALTLRDENDHYKVIRQRPANSSARAADQLKVQLPSGILHEGSEAEDWLASSGLPNWETYRRAHCFHQEAARSRVLEVSDRSAILASLLGLEQDVQVRELLESLKPSTLMRNIEDERSELEKDIERSLARPLHRIHEIENRIKEKGIDHTQINEEKINSISQRILQRARDLSAKLELDTTFPEVEDIGDAVRWGIRWPQIARQTAPALKPLESLRKQGKRPT